MFSIIIPLSSNSRKDRLIPDVQLVERHPAFSGELIAGKEGAKGICGDSFSQCADWADNDAILAHIGVISDGGQHHLEPPVYALAQVSRDGLTVFHGTV